MKTGGCPTCGGDIYIERDFYGLYVECLQCGRNSDSKQEAPRLVDPRKLKHFQGGRHNGGNALLYAPGRVKGAKPRGFKHPNPHKITMRDYV